MVKNVPLKCQFIKVVTISVKTSCYKYWILFNCHQEIIVPKLNLSNH